MPGKDFGPVSPVVGVNRAGIVVAGQRDDSETINPPDNWPRLGPVAMRIVERIARQHGLSRPHARVVTALAGIGGAP